MTKTNGATKNGATTDGTVTDDVRVAVVTGGAAGIGEAVCRRLAQDGMSVVVADLDAEGARRVAEDIVRAGGEATPCEVDVTDEAAVTAMYELALKRYGRLNYVAANAGIFVYDDLLTYRYEDFQRVMRVNVGGTLATCRGAARVMLAQGEGRGPRSIAITTSEGSFSQDPPSGVYITSKWAERGMMRSLAKALWPKGITVNGVGPGSVYTDLHKYINQRFAEMNDVSLEKATQLFAKVRPIRGYQPAEEVAAVFSFLFSDAARNMCGMTFMDNGGHVMC